MGREDPANASAWASTLPEGEARRRAWSEIADEGYDKDPNGTIAIVGAPKGSITVEGWSNREVEITAEIVVPEEGARGVVVAQGGLETVDTDATVDDTLRLGKGEPGVLLDGVGQRMRARRGADVLKDQLRHQPTAFNAASSSSAPS